MTDRNVENHIFAKQSWLIHTLAMDFLRSKIITLIESHQRKHSKGCEFGVVP